MNTETLRVWTARGLIGFVLITIGFSLGRRTAPLPDGNEDIAPATTEDRQANRDHVIVYAAHQTFRCSECNQIESLARELVESEFAGELAEGRLAFRTADYRRDTAFARKYDISSSTIVVTRANSSEFQRLDEVWTRIRNREDFFDYVRAAIRTCLETEDDS